MHPLKEFLTKYSLTEEGFAERLVLFGRSTTGSYISQIITGFRHPSRKLAKIISRGTAGEVTVAELLEFEPPADVKAAVG